MSLLGKVLVRRLDDGIIVRGRIVETESYLGHEDAASQSFKGKVTPRNEPMFMKPGTAYVYMTYGMYHCFNISSKGDGAAVLLRSIEPLDNLDTMISLRKQFRKCTKTVMMNKDLCNGPAKLCISFGIDIKSCNKQDLTSWDGMWVEEDEKSKLIDTIVCSPRIGIKCEKKWQDKFLRYYIRDNPCVSKIEKTKMNELKYSQIANIK
ncbi:PREDICTED: DNA-3-methyladenine glycosylase-like [Diuraphis noxia]|uniref:DNA-3-methyladenine glycosylase-like n=1 Tax=Diuraphis noxia TaxID=143948 RepID=UPI0007638F3C|nr:PREDICTED: DNA-3-methyladenine glycosylase-like [Diuraphis noxia]